MPQIGEMLREARMRQRLDIADVEQRTKIRAKYLRALENEEWGLLPGPTFVKTFLRTYAEVVGVDPHVLVEEYRQAHERTDEQDLQPLAPMPPGGGRRGPASGGPGRGVVAAAGAVALLAFLLALGLLGGDDAQDGGGRDDRPAATRTATTADPPAERERPRRPPPAPRGIEVRIVPLEPTYLCVDNGPATDVVYEGTLDAAETFRHRRLVRLNLGKRSAEIVANGEPVAVVESPEPLGLELRPAGAEEIAVGERPCT